MRRLLLLCALFVASPLPGASPASAAERHPVLLVHGFSGNATNRDLMRARFQSEGWRNAAFTYDSTQSSATIALRVRDEVDRLKAATGASKVDVVTHSMGGLSSRWTTGSASAAPTTGPPSPTPARSPHAATGATGGHGRPFAQTRSTARSAGARSPG